MLYLIDKYRKTFSIVVTCIVGWVCTLLTTVVIKEYTFGLFIWLPIVMGILTTALYGYNNPVGKSAMRDASFIALFIYCCGLLIFAMEGIICLIMAIPLGLLCSYIGYRIGYWIIKSKIAGITPSVLLFLVLSVPAVMGFEYVTTDANAIHPVITSIEINAPVEKVWENVIEFPQLQEPEEFIFKTGIAYPINATIDGNGVGAIRHCNFTTGSFIEPVTVWNKPELLCFDVLQQPEPMRELSPYNIRPNHLHGYFVSKKGQFKLIRLTDHRTKLEGTTWYYNRIKPGFYWTLWSDYIIHKIHLRVLNHIKKQAENN